MGLLETGERGYYASENYGSYQFVSLEDIINQFMIVYTGDDKVISKVRRTDVAFFAQRGLAEMSFDTFKSVKSQELDVPASLSIVLPQDYVNYTKLSWVDNAGIKHPIYPTKHTNNPFRKATDDDGDFIFNANGSAFYSGELIKNGNFNGTFDHWDVQLPTGGDPIYDDNNDPEMGWFIVENKAKAIDVGQFGKIRQYNIPILAGKSYKVTYTISDYSSGEVHAILIDDLGKKKILTTHTANGTYEETVDMSTATVVEGDASSFLDGEFSGANVFISNNSALANGNFTIDNFSIVMVGAEDESTTSKNYKANTPAENDNDNYEDGIYWPNEGERYGLEPSHAQINGSFYIDELRGKINFSSNISGKTVILDYISDSLGTDGEMQVHKFAEDAMYKYIFYNIVSGKANVPPNIVNRAKREKFASTRQAKLRLSNIKLEEITQILRGKSKQIKH